MFVLPFLAATHPPAARAMLEYRIRRLAASRAKPRAARPRRCTLPWESARRRRRRHPAHAYDQTGRIVPIRTGELEEHIVADVAWAAGCYVDWTGDAAFAAGPGASSSSRRRATGRRASASTRDGRGHIYGVIGPDEYHEPVDDNAFTNVMARWNLRRSRLSSRGLDPSPSARPGCVLADALVDGYDPETELYEQFAGFYGLEPLVIADVAPRARSPPTCCSARARRAAPGRSSRPTCSCSTTWCRRRSSRIARAEPGLLRAAHARTAARCPRRSTPRCSPAPGGSDQAVEPLPPRARASTRRPDRHDRRRSPPRDDGRALAGTGLRLRRSAATGIDLEIDPQLPGAWDALALRLRFRGHPVRVRLERERVTVESDHELPTSVGGLAPAYGTRTVWIRDEAQWKVREQMTTVVAAMDNTPSAGAVLASAAAVAQLFDATLEAVHVRSDGGEIAAGQARRTGVPLEIVDGGVVESLVAVGREQDVAALVLGTREEHTPDKPLGSTALAVVAGVEKPIVLIPPSAAPLEHIRRVLLRRSRTRRTSLAPASMLEIARQRRGRRDRPARLRRGVATGVHRPAAHETESGQRIPAVTARWG